MFVEDTVDMLDVYKRQEVAVNGKNSLKIVLQEDSETLDEVVVVGYGVQKKSVVTASIEMCIRDR